MSVDVSVWNATELRTIALHHVRVRVKIWLVQSTSKSLDERHTQTTKKGERQNTQQQQTSDEDTSLPFSLPYCPHCIPYADLERYIPLRAAWIGIVLKTLVALTGNEFKPSEKTNPGGVLFRRGRVVQQRRWRFFRWESPWGGFPYIFSFSHERCNGEFSVLLGLDIFCHACFTNKANFRSLLWKWINHHPHQPPFQCSVKAEDLPRSRTSS